ncbi:MAG: penicillin-binding protein 2 [Candidatus Omnitrophota bacterium]
MRSHVLRGAVVGMYCLLAFSLMHIQLIRSAEYRMLSDRNIIRVIPIEAPRGRIFDRNNKVVVDNKLSFDVSVIYHELSKAGRDKIAAILSDALGASKKKIRSRIEEAKLNPFIPAVVFEDIGKSRAILLQERLFDITGIIVESRAKRDYPHKEDGSHLIGYLGEVNRKELERLKPYGYRIKDLVGRGGLEDYYNGYLMGKGGGFLVEVDNRGRQVRVLGLKEPKSGKDLHLTIDIEIQKEAEKLLEDKKGAIIVMKSDTGEVLALVSRPGFDPNVFVSSEGSPERVRLMRDKNYPLLNRALSGTYPPGSVFKIVVASAALEYRKGYEWKTFECDGAYVLGRRSFRCWYDRGHNKQHMREGIKNSCNVYFFNLGKELGVDRIESFANRFGFGRPSGIDLPGEAAGLVPGRLWKRLRMRSSWYMGETLNFSIGQGYLLATPLQALGMMNVIADGGKLVRPFIVRRIGDTDITSVRANSIGLSDATVEILSQSLVKVVNDKDGTGRLAKVEGVKMAGKTGTAQVSGKKSHSWFSGFAPADDPKISLLIFVEHGGKGGVEAAQMAKTLFEELRDREYL